MRHTSARPLGLLAAIAAGALGLQVAGTTTAGAAAPTPASTRSGVPALGATGSTAFRADRAHDAVAALVAHRGAARQGTAAAFHPTSTITDPGGATHVRMDRTYRGIPVVGGDVVVHQGAAGGWRGTSQTLRTPLSLRTDAAVPAARATERVLGARSVSRGVSGQRAQGEPRLVVDALGGAPRLAWQVTTVGRRADGTPSRLTTYVDARTGAVRRSEEHVQTVDGQGQSLYSGTVPLQLTKSGSSYQLKDPTRGNTYTTDMQNKSDSYACQLLGIRCSTGTLFTSPDTSFGTGSTSSRESAAVDAQYGTNETWDYYNDVHGRNGIFGTGKGSFNRVHYGNGYVNAFWDGTKMTYGDGDGTSYGPLVSLDVAGHEMSHGVTENTAGLTYSGESGGLNEATSDIFGTMVEFYANNASDPGDYLIGEQFDLARHQGFRRMDNPIADGDSPNCYSANTKNLDVHYSSGVGNHFFYLLAEGSGAKTINGVAHNSPTCNGSSVTGIGRDKAQRIWFKALTAYMTSGTTYSGARTATLDAARDLFGAGSAEYTTVASAWSAVGVS